MGLAGFLLLSFGTNMLDFIWHGLNYPDSLPARQSFVYILLVLTMCHDAYRHVRELEGQLGSRFLRTHRAYLVNVEQIAELDLKDREIRMKNGERCLFARNMKGALLERM